MHSASSPMTLFLFSRSTASSSTSLASVSVSTATATITATASSSSQHTQQLRLSSRTAEKAPVRSPPDSPSISSIQGHRQRKVPPTLSLQSPPPARWSQQQRDNPFESPTRPPRRQSFQPWNPVNQTPRPSTGRSSLIHSSDSNVPPARPRDVPLLKVPESRLASRGRQSPSSLAVEPSIQDSEAPSISSRASVALPRDRRSLAGPSTNINPIVTVAMADDRAKKTAAPFSAIEATESPLPVLAPVATHLSAPKDLELGRKPSVRSIRSTLPRHPGTDSTTASDEAAEDPEWGPSHPCYPHLNPHVPKNSPEYDTTRIIRIRRDWMVAGDLAPTFSNLYPEILEPWLPEQEFRRLIAKLNEELEVAFDPWEWRNWMDAVLGLFTGWLWEDLGFAIVKKRLKSLEDWLEDWNQTIGRGEVKIIPLRRTGYLTLDIQIPDPHVGVIGSEISSRPNTSTPVPLTPRNLNSSRSNRSSGVSSVRP